MKIDICSHEEVSWICDKNPKEIDVILIVNSLRKHENTWAVQSVIEKARNLLLLTFDDIENPLQNFEMPDKQSICKAIEFAKNKEKLIVSCTAGISRSAAMAYVILCSKMPPEDAIKHLNAERHIPNSAIVRLGKNVLGIASMENVLYKWQLNNMIQYDL